MTRYERGYYDGERAKELGLPCDLPDAVTATDRFVGYCDGYMCRPYNEPKPTLMVKVLTTITFETK